MHDSSEVAASAPPTSAADSFSKAIDAARNGGNSAMGTAVRQVAQIDRGPMRSECVKAELDSAEMALEECWRMLEQLSMHIVGIPPTPQRDGWPGGDSVADRSARVRQRAAEMMPIMNVLLQRLA